jgi:small nuclear ribonucleoprotein (snRNP)-like protein
MSIEREYNSELAKLVDQVVKVYISEKKYFVGQLKGVSKESNLILTGVKNEKGQALPKVLISHNYYQFIALEEEPFPMQALADRISTVFSKGHVNYSEEQGIISILNGKIVVDENGVRGSGPTANRVKKIYDQFMMDME